MRRVNASETSKIEATEKNNTSTTLETLVCLFSCHAPRSKEDRSLAERARHKRGSLPSVPLFHPRPPAQARPRQHLTQTCSSRLKHEDVQSKCCSEVRARGWPRWAGTTQLEANRHHQAYLLQDPGKSGSAQSEDLLDSGDPSHSFSAGRELPRALSDKYMLN